MSMDRKRKINFVVLSFARTYAFGIPSLGYLKDQMYSQRVKTLDELKAPITAATVNVTNDTLQRV
jgi:hypothetical protein